MGLPSFKPLLHCNADGGDWENFDLFDLGFTVSAIIDGNLTVCGGNPFFSFEFQLLELLKSGRNSLNLKERTDQNLNG